MKLFNTDSNGANDSNSENVHARSTITAAIGSVSPNGFENEDNRAPSADESITRTDFNDEINRAGNEDGDVSPSAFNNEHDRARSEGASIIPAGSPAAIGCGLATRRASSPADSDDSSHTLGRTPSPPHSKHSSHSLSRTPPQPHSQNSSYTLGRPREQGPSYHLEGLWDQDRLMSPSEASSSTVSRTLKQNQDLPLSEKLARISADNVNQDQSLTPRDVSSRTLDRSEDNDDFNRTPVPCAPGNTLLPGSFSPLLSETASANASTIDERDGSPGYLGQCYPWCTSSPQHVTRAYRDDTPYTIDEEGDDTNLLGNAEPSTIKGEDCDEGKFETEGDDEVQVKKDEEDE